jgi:hypothetical protein
MTLKEVLGHLRFSNFYDELSVVNTCNMQADVADRIHDLTRWIPVEERMPTEADYSEAGQIHLWDAEFGICRVYHKDIAHDFLKRIPLEFTHWKRITPPEGA